MDKPKKNVQIPLELFNDLVYAFEQIDIESYTPEFRCRLQGIFEALQRKRKAMELRDDYKRMIDANNSGDEESKIIARAEYLIRKHTD